MISIVKVSEMKPQALKILGWASLLIFVLSAAQPAAQAQGIAAKASRGGPMVIHSDTLEADNLQRTVTFSGKVKAEREDFIIHCERMVVHYTRSENAGAPGDATEGSSIEKIVARGNVRVDRTEGGTATAEEAVYYENESKVVLSGNPVLKQENDTVQGERVIFFIEDDRVVVEGSEKKRVKAVVFPKSDNKDKQPGAEPGVAQSESGRE